MSETWLPVTGYEDIYQVSDHGRVLSIPHTRTGRAKNGAEFVRQYKGKLLQARPNKFGHLQVHLCRNGLRKVMSVHLLVLDRFVCPRPLGLNGLHKDDNKLNNHVSNLYWGTLSENNLDCVRNGNHHWASKTCCPQGHEYSEENTIWRVRHNGKWRTRDCRACGREAQRRYRSRILKH